ncbi:MAG: hypothetical protein ABEI86_02940, partial [Halobacteriaceae archaeon]
MNHSPTTPDDWFAGVKEKRADESEDHLEVAKEHSSLTVSKSKKWISGLGAQSEFGSGISPFIQGWFSSGHILDSSRQKNDLREYLTPEMRERVEESPELKPILKEGINRLKDEFEQSKISSK